MSKLIWQNGVMKPYDEAQTHVMSHALHYGTGTFEGIRAYTLADGGVGVLCLKEHVKRMFDSATALAMKIPYSEQQVCDAILQVIKANELGDCYIRPLAYYGRPTTSGVRIMPAADTPIDVIISCYAMGNYLPDEAIHVKISDIVRLHPQSTNVGAKICGHYINSLQALMQIRDTKYSEVVMLDYEGNVSEGSSDNIFMIKNQVVYTPMCGGILNGITRNVVMQLAVDLGHKVVETIIKPQDLCAADEVFITGTAVEVRGVASVDDQDIGAGNEGPITQLIKNEYKKICAGQNPKYRHLLSLLA